MITNNSVLLFLLGTPITVFALTKLLKDLCYEVQDTAAYTD